MPALGTLPGLFCPHYDIVESNGELRATPTQRMLQLDSVVMPGQPFVPIEGRSSGVEAYIIPFFTPAILGS